MFGFWVLFSNFLFYFYAFTSHYRNTWNKNALFVSCHSLGFVCCFLWGTPPLSLWLLLLPRWSDSTNKAAVIISGSDAISNWANLNGIANMDAQLGVHRCLLQYKYHTAHPPIPPSGHILYHNYPWATYWARKFQQILVVLYNVPLPTRPLYHQIVSGSVANWFQMAEPTLFKFALSWAARAVQKALMPVLIPNSILLHHCRHRHNQCRPVLISNSILLPYCQHRHHQRSAGRP